MDQHILDILKATEEAQAILENNDHVSDFNDERLGMLKSAMEKDIVTEFEKQRALLNQKHQQAIDHLNSSLEKERYERSEDLRRRFSHSKNEWEHTLFERVTTLK